MANASHLASTAYFQGLFERRRRQPGDDLTTQLVQAEEGGSQLSNEKLTANIILLFGAGQTPTARHPAWCKGARDGHITAAQSPTAGDP